jgi:tetrahydromethanopterin S-methyltransferase subunit C
LAEGILLAVSVAKIYFATPLRTNIFALIMKLQVNLDALGVLTSVACAVHCAVLPLVLTSLPLFGINIINNNFFETGMIGLAFVIGSFALYHGYKRHHHRVLPLLIFSAGFILLVLKQIFIVYEILLLIPAATFILAAHFFNYRFCRKANHCHPTDCDH